MEYDLFEKCVKIMLVLIHITIHNAKYIQTITASFGEQKTNISTSLDYFYDPFEMVKQASPLCQGRYICSDSDDQTFPDKNCHCDSLCLLLNDCCENYTLDDVPVSTLNTEQFSCVIVPEIVKNRQYGLQMVTKCHYSWGNEAVKTMCEVQSDDDNIFLRLPVTGKSGLNVMYSNMFCAQCNHELDFYYWNPEMKCANETGVRSLPKMSGCDWFYIRPKPEVDYRLCQVLPEIIDTCLPNGVQDSAKNNCTNGEYALVYSSQGVPYKNTYCALCNNVTGDMFCDSIDSMTPQPGWTTTKTPKKTYSFRILVDFNLGTEMYNDEAAQIQQCNENELYDSFAKVCREIYCAPPSFALNGKCRLPGNETHTNNTCTLIKLHPSEYQIMNNSDLFILLQEKVYNSTDFQIIGSDVFICAEKMQTCLKDCHINIDLLDFDTLESMTSLVALVISIAALAITLLIYISCPQLLNVPGKILICLIISLMLAQTSFLISGEVKQFSQICIAVGVLLHYFYLAAFCWMNIIAFDLSVTFSNKYVTSSSGRKGTKRFAIYSLYAWLTPLAIVATALIMDNVQFDKQYHSLKPGYGKKSCWISSRDALVLFFAGPLALFKIFDIIAFIYTSVNIARARKQSAFASRKTSTCSCLINVKLSLVMGLTWVFAFIANATNEPIMWYLFIIFNSLQGLFIAVSFLCTRQVGRLLRAKYETFSSKTTSGTQMSSLS